MTKEHFEVYKKWRRSSNSAGFASFYNWPHSDRVVIEIADVDPNTNARISMSTCYIPTFEFLAYLHAEINGRTEVAYRGLHSIGRNHGLLWFGGRNIARVFKIEDWAFDPNEPDSAIRSQGTRRFKAGEFEIKAGSKASEPDYSKRINQNMIQMKPGELSILYHGLLINQQAYEALVLQSGMSKEEFRAQFDDRQYAEAQNDG